jgi:signal transduction histidine kinase/CHASE2 domain-containing sensor protein
MPYKKIIVFILFILGLFYFLGLFEAINRNIFENYILFNKDKGFSKDIVIIKIDDKTVDSTSEIPISRTLYTDLLHKLGKHPAVVGFLISFTEPHGEKIDKKLYNALRQTKNIVLMSRYKFTDISNLTLAVPEKNIFSDLTYGHSLIDYSFGGVVESIQPIKKYPAFALAILNKYYQDYPHQLKDIPPGLTHFLNLPAQKLDTYTTNQKIIINYKKNPDQFKQYSCIDVVNGKVNPAVFTNKIVLVGVSDKNLTRTYITPFTGDRTKTKTSTGVELQAQIIDSLMNARIINKINLYVNIVLSVLITVFFILLIKRKTAVMQGVYLLTFLFIFSVINYGFFTLQAIWYPPALTYILLIFSFTLSEYFSYTEADELTIKAINRLQTSQDLPLKEVSYNLPDKVNVLTTLIDVISRDRQTIQKIIDGVNSGILVLNEKGSIIKANSRIKEIFHDDQIIKKSISGYIRDFDFDDIKQEIETEEISKKEIVINEKEYLFVCNTIDEVNEFVAIITDISEFKMIDRLKSDMVKMVSHELKNPLASIRLCAENIVFMEESESSVSHGLRIINTSMHLMDTINNFLNISKLEHNFLEFDFKEANLITTIKECIELQKPLLESKNIQIELQLPDKPVLLQYDIKQILVVMNVLLSNAIKYSKESSQIIITLTELPDSICVSVRDFGIGIPEAEKDKIFEKFYRSSNNKINNIEGTGLGLTIIKKILEAHDGGIKVESTPNEGSTFVFNLPRTSKPRMALSPD